MPEQTPSPPIATSAEPRDAAALIIVDRSGPEPRVMMGRRSANQIFLPGKYVFPGGRVETGDAAAPAIDQLDPYSLDALSRSIAGDTSPARLQGFAATAIRETYEETGHLVGQQCIDRQKDVPVAWQSYFAHGVAPSLAALSFFARALTPPGRVRRYDTRFFIADRKSVAKVVHQTDGELDPLGWFTMAEIAQLDVAGITRILIEDLKCHLLAPQNGRDGGAGTPIPYYAEQDGRFCRHLLSRHPGSA